MRFMTASIKFAPANRCFAAPPGAERQFVRTLHAQPCWPEAVAERSAASRILSTSSPSPQTGKSTPRAWLLVVGVVIFAALMALRHELSSVWVRAAVAACASAGLDWAIMASRKPQFPDKYESIGVFSYVLVMLPWNLAFKHGQVQHSRLMIAFLPHC